MQNLTYLVPFTFLITIAYAQPMQMEIEGSIRISDNENPQPGAGTIRWSGEDFEGWNGVKWVSLTGHQRVGIVADIDGNTYRTFQIGEQEWMVDNLRTSRYQNGTQIEHITDDNEWSSASSGAWCWYNNDPTMENPFGKLYNWHAVNDAANICPTGWIVASKDQYEMLFDYLTMVYEDQVATRLKLPGTDFWLSATAGDNASGFSASGAGFRQGPGLFFYFKEYAFFWTNTNFDIDSAYYINLKSGRTTVLVLTNSTKNMGKSVRCVKAE